jgi:hypothetical protein
MPPLLLQPVPSAAGMLLRLLLLLLLLGQRLAQLPAML